MKKIQHSIHAVIVAASFLMLSATPPERLAVVDVSVAGPFTLGLLKKLGGISWWTEFGGKLLVSANQRGFVNMRRTGFAASPLPESTTSESLRVVVGGHHAESLPLGISVLIDEGRVRLVEGDAAALANLDQSRAEANPAWGVSPVQPNRVVLRHQVNDDRVHAMSARDSVTIRDAAGKVSQERWWADVQKLAGWNRHIAAPGNITAREWLKANLALIPGMEATIQEFKVQGRSSWNVVGILTGERMVYESGAAHVGDRGLIVVGGHFDSTSERTSTAAPGAEDNASGAAGVLELARVMAEMPHTQDIVFVAFSGEEQGLYGSAAFVEALPESERERVRGVLTMDMIAYARNGAAGKLGVLIETEETHADFARRFVEAARQVTKLEVSTSYNPFGSDHVSFLEAGMPAILAIDADWNRYGHYHRTTDTPDKLTPELALEILKMNAATLALLAR